MIHSRPGFRPRTSDEECAKLQPDMVPAINRHNQPETTNLKTATIQHMQAQAEAALKRMKDGSQVNVLVNPNPSATPVMTSPHKD